MIITTKQNRRVTNPAERSQNNKDIVDKTIKNEYQLQLTNEFEKKELIFFGKY